MKLLRDVARRSSRPGIYPWGADVESDYQHGPNHGYWGEQVGRTSCCGWNYSQHALDDNLIRHHNSCSAFNSDGLNEF